MVGASEKNGATPTFQRPWRVCSELFTGHFRFSFPYFGVFFFLTRASIRARSLFFFSKNVSGVTGLLNPFSAPKWFPILIPSKKGFRVEKVLPLLRWNAVLIWPYYSFSYRDHGIVDRVRMYLLFFFFF